jgi:hypothetical protein
MPWQNVPEDADDTLKASDGHSTGTQKPTSKKTTRKQAQRDDTLGVPERHLSDTPNQIARDQPQLEVMERNIALLNGEVAKVKEMFHAVPIDTIRALIDIIGRYKTWNDKPGIKSLIGTVKDWLAKIDAQGSDVK